MQIKKVCQTGNEIATIVGCRLSAGPILRSKNCSVCGKGWTDCDLAATWRGATMHDRSAKR
jgi:hypothetical protein